MALADLEGKRTGRKKGTKPLPRWMYDLRWAEKHINKPDAEPPTPLAGLLVEMARKDPDKFVACLALRQPLPGVTPEPAKEPTSPAPTPSAAPQPAQKPARYVPLVGLRTVVVDHKTFREMLSGGGPPKQLSGFPEEYDIVLTMLTPRGVLITIRSNELPNIDPSREPIPEVKAGVIVTGGFTTSRGNSY